MRLHTLVKKCIYCWFISLHHPRLKAYVLYDGILKAFPNGGSGETSAGIFSTQLLQMPVLWNSDNSPPTFLQRGWRRRFIFKECHYRGGHDPASRSNHVQWYSQMAHSVLLFISWLYFFNTMVLQSSHQNKCWQCAFLQTMEMLKHYTFTFLCYDKCFEYALVRFRHINHLGRVRTRSCFGLPQTQLETVPTSA